MDYNLKGKVVLVTGAGSGIGKPIAVEFAKVGASIVVNYHSDTSEAEEVLGEIEKNNSSGIMIQADVSKEVDVIRMFSETAKKFGSIDVLVNNAGIEKNNSFTEMTLAEWQAVIDTNLTGY